MEVTMASEITMDTKMDTVVLEGVDMAVEAIMTTALVTLAAEAHRDSGEEVTEAITITLAVRKSTRKKSVSEITASANPR